MLSDDWIAEKMCIVDDFDKVVDEDHLSRVFE